MTTTTNEDTTQKPTHKSRFNNKHYQVIWGMLLYLLSTTSLYGQSPYISIATGNWSDDATWSGTGIPGPSDVVQIRGGFTVTVNTTTAVCGSLKVGGDNANNNTGTLGFATSGNPHLKISGNLQIGGDGNAVRKGTVIFQNNATLTTGGVILGGVGSNPAPGVLSMNNGGILKTGSLALGAGVPTWEPGWGTVELTAANTIPNTIFTVFFNLIISSGTTTMSAAKLIMDQGALTLNGGTLSAGNNLAMTTNSSIKRHDGNMTGTLQGSGVFDVTYTGNTKTTGPELNNGGLRNVSVNLLPGKIVTLSAAATPDGNLSVINGTLDLSTFTINRSLIGGTLSIGNGAFLKIGGTNPTPTNYTSRIFGTTSTVEYYGGTQNITSESFGHLIISAGTKTTSGTISVSGNFTCSNGATVNTANNWNPMAHWAVDGFFNQTNSTTTFSSGITHEIAGAGISQFNNLTTSSATINANDHSIYIAGNWVHGSSGIFNAESSTVRFNGSGIQTQPATEFVPSFYNLKVNKTGGTLSSRIWTVTNDFELMLGAFAPNDGSSFLNVKITDGTFTAPSGNINVAGNWTRNGGIFSHGIGKVTFNSAVADQNINGSQDAQSFYNLTLIKGNKTLYFSGAITTVAVRNILAMTSGNINLGTNGVFELGTSPSSVGSLNYTSGTIINGTSGGFMRWIAASSEPGIDFPVGTASNMYKARIIFNNNTGGSLTARFDAGNPGNNTGFPLEESMLPIYEDGLYTEGTWSLIPESLTSTDYDLELTGTGFNSGGAEDGTVRILKRPDAGGDWTLDGMHVTGSGDVAKRSGLSGFSRFAHARPCLNPATVYAGVDQTICKGGSAILAGTIGGGASSATWSDGGTGGSFSPNNTTLNATYTPPSGFTGSINLKLTTNDPSGSCPAALDIMVLTVVMDPAAPTATKSPNVTNVCEGQPLTLTGVMDNGGGTGTCVIEYRYNNGSGFSSWSTTLPLFSAVTGINKIEIRKNCNGAGCDLSNVSTYTWTVVADPAAPTAIQSPDDATVCVGQVLTLSSVTDNGGGTGSCAIEYRYNNGSGFTAWSTTPASFPGVAGINTIEIRKNCTGADCNISPLSSYSWTVVADPTVADPAGMSVCHGQTATLSVAPQGGTGDFSYQWQQMTANCASPQNVGNDAPSFTTIALAPGTYYYRCVITQSGAGCNPLTTNCATVIVHPNPSCSITGPSSLCPSSIGTIYQAPPGMTGYVWSITGSGTITGSMTSQSVTVNAGPGCNTSYQLSLSVTDGNACTSVCTKTVNVLDVIDPTIACPTGAINRNTNEGECTYAAIGAEFDPAGSFDNCGIASTTNDYSNTGTLAGVEFPIGTTVVNWTISDHCNNTATCSITIIVGNDIDPVISCPETDNLYLTDPGQCYASLSFEASVDDDCGVASTQYSILGNVITFPHEFAVGTTTVDVMVTDATGNSAVCSFNVLVEDHEKPTVECPKPLYPFQVDEGQCTATLSLSATSSDNCGVATTSYFIGDTPIDFPHEFNVGSTVVYVVVTDVHGNFKTCYFTVVVEDHEDPSVECPKPLYPYPVDEGECTASLIFAAVSMDNCGIDATSYFIGDTPISFPYDFPVGSTVVYVMVSDIHDNITTCHFTVVVEDLIEPVITCPVPLGMYTAPPGQCHVALSFAATSTDNCGVASTTYSVGENTITFPYEFPVGSTTVNVLVTDIHGNGATCSFAVVVVDQENPAITCPVPMNPYTTDAGSCEATLSFTATSTDNCGIAGTTYKVGTSAIVFPYDFPVGSTLVKALVTDIHGNTASCSFTVQVIDLAAPMVTCPTLNNPYTADEGDCDATLTLNAVTTDNCGVASVAYSVNGNSITFPYNFPIGTTVVSVLVTDIHSNSAACSYTVVVEDDELPIVNCPQSVIEYTADEGECNTTLSFEVASTDNCGVATTQYKIGGQPITFPYDFPIGSTLVSVYVTDIHGNIAVCAFTIIVEDHENPLITCEVPAESYSADSGDCDATLSFTSTSTDNCGIAGTEYSIGGSLISFPYDFPVGTTEVSVVAVDYSGNMATCFFLVTVTDEVNPIVECPEVSNPYPTDPGNCHAVMSFEPYATDNCGIANTVYNVGESSIDFPYYFPVGSTIVDAVATDIYGNSASCSFEVIVEDQELPVVECPVPNNPYMTDAGECNATLGFESFATDNCGLTTTDYIVGSSTITFPYDFPVGSTVVTALVTDLQGNITSCTFTVVVEDNVNPVVECPTVENSYPTDAGACSASLSFGATSADNCEIATTNYSVGEELITFPYDFAVGITTVNALVTDLSGNTAWCSFNVIVEDVESPIVECPVLLNSYPTDPGECYATLSFVVGATDNCGLASTTYSIGSNTITFPHVFAIGSTVVNVLTTDIHGNTTACAFTVVVEDEEQPIISCPIPLNPYAADEGQCDAALSFVATSTDNCAVASTSYSVGGNTITFPHDFGVGSTEVTVLVTDIHGNTSNCSFNVVVEDTQDPVVMCPILQNPYTADAGQCYASLSFVASSTDNCGVSSSVYSVGENPIVFPYNFPVGSTTVNVVVADMQGNTGSCYFVVMVEDEQNPVAICPILLNSYTTDPGECNAALSFAASATDNCEVDNIVYSLNGNAIDFPYDFPVGATVVDVVVTDIHGNSSECSFTVNVEDDEQPVITCPVPLSMYSAHPGACHVALSFTASSTDNCGVASTAYSVGANTITFPYEFPVGSTTVNVLVTDIHGNSSACSFAVVVVDQENPAITCPVPMNPYTTDAGSCEATLSFTATSTDNCGIAGTTYKVGTSAIVFPYDFPVGSTLVKAIVTDIHGNTSSCSFTVQVIDLAAPMVTCPALNNPYTADEGDCDATLTLNAVTTDNCGVASVAYSVNGNAINFPYNFPVGTTVVNVLATDIHANTSSCSYTVVVEDDELPIVNCPQSVIEYTADEGECNTTLSFEVASTDNCGVATTQYKIGGQPITFPYDFPIGPTLVSVYVTDIHGNIAVCSFTIIVEDHENPLITCEVPAESYSADSGDCDATLSFTSTSTDNCGIAGTEYSIGGSLISFPYDFPVGTTEVSVVAVDYSGNMASCFFLVTVTDEVNPIVVCPEVSNPYPTDPGNCHAVMSFEPYATDNCGIANTVYNVGESSIDFPYYFPIGSTIIDAVATDIYGNSASCSFEVIVEDQEYPVVECPIPNNPYLTDAGECNATLGFESFATDNCGLTTTDYIVGSSTITFPYDFPVGSTVVTALVTDLQGNITSCTFTVVVEDNINPVVACPILESSYPTDAGACSASLSFDATSMDNCEVATTTYSIGEDLITFPYDFAEGMTTVNVVVADLSGNTAWCSFNVIVEDVESPVVECPLLLNSYTTDPGECNAALSFAASATDNCEVDNIVYSLNGNAIDFPYDFPVGATVVDVLVTDIHGNSSECSFTVNVEDDEQPVITCPVPLSMYSAHPGACHVALSFAASSTDNCGVASTAYSVGANTITFPYEFPVGSTTVNVLVTDTHGNSSACSFAVVVVDQENPAITCPVPMNPYTTDAGSCEATLSFTATSTDNCGIAGTTYKVGSSAIVFPYDFPVGSTLVKAIVTDIHGNTSSCSFTVQVIDLAAPTVTCPVPANPYTADEGDCDATLTLNAVTTDNCGVASVAYSVNGNAINFPYNFPVGTTVVSVLVTDIHSNSAACSYTVVVEDDELPIVNCPQSVIEYTADEGECNTTLSFEVASTDNCGVATTQYKIGGQPITFPYDFPIGPTLVSVYVSDIHGNIAVCSFTIIVEDHENPLITCEVPAESYSADSGDCDATLSFTSTSTDNCGIAGTEYSIGGSLISFPYDFPVGTTEVSVVAVDYSGNMASCFFLVAVTDEVNPIVVCPEVSNPYPTDPGNCHAVMSFEPYATDNCGIANTVYNVGESSIDFPYYFPIGSTIIDAVATDIYGNSASCSFEVIVEDQEYPVVECPVPNNPYITDEGECNATIGFESFATDNCGLTTTDYIVGSSTISFPYDFPVGSTEVTALVTDLQGNITSCTFTVVVEDNLSPVVECPLPSNPYAVDPGECNATLSFEATSTDNCEIESIVYTLGQVPNIVQEELTIEVPITFPYDFLVGSTVVNVLVTDINGNSSSCSFTVDVVDNELPLFQCPLPANPYTTDAGNCSAALNFGVDATDNCGVESIVYKINASPITFPYQFPVGSTVVNTLVTDIHGNSAACSFAVVVVDLELPVVACPLPAISYATDPGECDRTLSFTATASDNCGIASLLYSVGGNQITFPYNFHVGATEVNVLVTDFHGNVTSCGFTVVVEDDEYPLLTCPVPANPYSAEPEECSATLSFEGLSTDNCGVASTVYIISGNPIVFPYSFPIGSTEVGVEVTDLHGNTSACTFSVVVEDNELPTILCPAPVNTYTVDAGECNTTLDFETTVSDNCGIESIQYSINGDPIDLPFDFPVGVTAVTILVSDIHGNSVECSFEVVVTDVEIPAITCGMNISQSVDAGACNANVLVITPAVSDNCGVQSVLNSNNWTADASGIYPVGTTTIVWAVTDLYGNTNTCTQTITVTDDEDPQIVCAPGQSQIADAGQCDADVEIAGPVTSDNCGVASLINSYNGTADASDNYPVGTTIVIWTLSDIHGNTSTCAQTISINDTQLPLNICAPSQIQTSDAGECNADVEVAGPLTGDNCGVATIINSYNNSSDASANYPVGTTMVLWTVTDVHGNASTCNQSITVTDGENPEISCAANQIQTAAEGECFAVVSVLTPSTDDNCGVASILNSYNGTVDASGNYQVGTTTVIWTVTDIHGNTSTCTQLITVTDDEDPSITCAPAQVQVAESGECSAEVTVTGPSTMDNCGVATLINSFNGTSNASGIYPVGVTTVLWTITDIHGNTNTCNQLITVTDTEVPVVFPLATNIFVECNGGGNQAELTSWLSTHGGASATDNCGGLTWSDDFESMSDECGMTGSIVVIFTVTDQSGNSAQTTASFTIIDTTPPALTNAAVNQIVGCDGNGNVSALNSWLSSHGGASASDMCGMVTWSHDFSGMSNGCGETGVAVVNFTATDDCGNSITTTATFTISDSQAPYWINIPVNDSEECDGGGNVPGLNAWLNSFTADDICGSAVVTSSFIQIVDACGSTGSLLYNFVATDECGNSISKTATFTITDTADPAWVNMPLNQTVECDGNGNNGQLTAWLNSFTADDLCNDVIVTNNFSSLSNLCGATGTANVTFTATDECGNSIQKAATFSIVDTSHPYWVNEPVNLTVECNGTGNTIEFNSWLNGFTADDNCGNANVTYTFTSFNGGCGSTLSTTVNFKATDECGNMISKVAVFTISDTSDPFWVNMPQDLVVECDGTGNSMAFNSWLTGFTAGDNCGDAVVTYTYTSMQGECGSTTIKTANFTATDECGNTINKLATFTIEDHTIPMITFCPPNVMIACDAENGVGVLGNITASDICDANISIGHTDSNTQGTDPELCDYYAYTITRTFTATDDCGNTATCVQTISVHDLEGPDMMAGVIDDCYATVELAEAAALAATTYSDDCDNMVTLTVETGQSSGCDSLITVTGTDVCGNSSQVMYTVLIGCAVTNAYDNGPGSLRNALVCALEGAEIAFDPFMVGQTIVLTSGEIVVNRNITINGLGMPNLTISGNNESRIFHVMPGYVVTAKNMTLKDGHDPINGGAVMVEGTLNLENVMFSNNFQGGVPRALTLTPSATLNILGNVEVKN